MPEEQLADVEASLWQRVRQDGDESARHRLIEHYRGYAHTVAAVLYGRRIDDDIPFDDYVQWATLGMVESVDRFDPSQGILFRTFASHRMRGRVLDGIDSATEKQRQIAARRRARQERTQAIKELASDGRTAGAGKRGPDLQELFSVLAEASVGMALSIMLEGTGMIEEQQAIEIRAYEHIELRQLREKLHACVGRLTQQEQSVIRLHYLDEMPVQDIAGMMNLTKGRISQIHRQALTKLKGLLAMSPRPDIVL